MGIKLVVLRKGGIVTRGKGTYSRSTSTIMIVGDKSGVSSFCHVTFLGKYRGRNLHTPSVHLQFAFNFCLLVFTLQRILS
jgi:hypothetical protein